MASRPRRPALDEVVRGRVRAYRAQRGLTQEQLSEVAGISIDAVNRIENGTRTPTLDTLDRLAAGLGVEVADLLRVEPTAPPRFKPPVQRIVAHLAQQPDEIQEAAERLVKVLLSVTAR